MNTTIAKLRPPPSPRRHRRRTGLVHRPGSPDCRAPRRQFRDRRLGALVRPRAFARRRPRPRHRRRSRLWQRRRRCSPARARAADGDRGRRHHDAERQPLCARGRGARARPRRHLRQAADDQSRRRARSRRAASAPPASSSARPSTTPASRWSVRRAPWSATATSARSAWSTSSTSRATTPPCRATRRAGEPANWRFRPERGRPVAVLGDIGSHAHHWRASSPASNSIASWPTSPPSFPAGTTDDYAGILFRLDNGAPGAMWMTQAGAGAVHGLYFRVFGDEGRSRMVRGGAEPALSFPPRQAGADLRARRPRPEAGSANAPSGSASATPRATRRPSPSSIPTPPRPIVARRLGETRPPRPRFPDRRGRRPHDEVHRRGARSRRQPAPGSIAG